MNIGICEDNKIELEKLEAVLGGYKTPDGGRLCYQCFKSSFELISSMEKNAYDALIMDILMPGLNGMEAAHDIRVHNEAVPIIFLTSSPEFAVESYSVMAYDYILKPVDPTRLYATLNRIYSDLGINPDTLSIETPKAIFRLSYNSIDFVEVSNRTLTFHLTDGSDRSVTGRLSDFEDRLLSRPGFCKVHRAFIVNLDFMRSLESKEFISLSGKSIPISRNLTKEVHDAFVKRLHDNLRS
ncbi:MAG: LytTR family DNA-binding domain-containing protein [Lachnospiraceae bacterium]|nr:LytTR family DNA-binding domain-containing protein [Lachnospiraceae bacterium]